MRATITPSSAARALGLLAFLAAAAGPVSAGSFTKRLAHTATLLPDGNILVAGGLTTPGSIASVTSEAQLLLERINDLSAAASMNVARASHTATLLPDGKVLVTGGINSGGVLTSVEVYDPSNNCWHPASLSMSAARFNHTATLLKTGNVLICGGQNGGGTMNSSCDLYTPPASPVACGSASGSLAATGAMTIPRSIHTATLLPDGRVFIAGGFDPTLCPTCSNTTYIVTTELYNPGSGTFGAAKNLIQQRAFHTATMMGNGKVLIAGGVNSKDEQANRGILDTAEIYDPVADSMIPAAAMKARTLAHAAVLLPDGQVSIYGGLGNIATTYINASQALQEGAVLTGASPPLLSTVNVTGGSLSLDLSFSLSKAVTGTIRDGFIMYSTPSVTFTEGIAYFKPGTPDPALGLRSDLAGKRVEDGAVNSSVSLSPLQGQYFIFPKDVSPDNINPLTTGSQIAFTAPTPSQPGITASSSPATINPTGSALKGSLTVSVSKLFLGGTVSSGTLTLSGASISASVAAITITNGFTVIPGNPTVVSDGAGGAEITFNADFSNLAGSVQSSSATAQFSPLVLDGSNPNIAAPQMTSMRGTMNFVVTRVDLSGQSFRVDIATVVINSMVLANQERYNPQSNEWSVGSTEEGFGRTATLTPSGEVRLMGGSRCNPLFINISCPLIAGSTVSHSSALGEWSPLSGNMASRRGNHTSTLLGDGTILIAGGTNGPNILGTAEILNPAAGTFSAAGIMRETRNLHTATLLSNGRVLIAGGFTTTGSTGTTSGAEIYYPETKVFRPTQSMASPRDNHSAVLLGDGNALITGGYTGSTYLSSSEIYYSTAAAWKSIPAMNSARALHTATLLQDSRVLVTGGINATGVLGSVEMYDPTTGSWSNKASFPSSKRAHSHRASLLLDGRVLVTGGNDGFGEVDYTLIYDPASDSWKDPYLPSLTPGGKLAAKRFNHTAMTLPNGLVLVAGGAQGASGGRSLNTVEVFHVSTSSWVPVGTLSAARAYHSFALAKNGSLFAIGGHDGTNYLNSVDSVYFSAIPDNVSVGAPPSARKSSVTAVDHTPFQRGAFVTMTGGNFQGVTEASGGGAAAPNSSHYGTRLILQSADSPGGSNFTLDLSTRIYSKTPDPNLWSKSNSSITVQMPPAAQSPLPGAGTFLPYGWYHLRTGANAQYADSLLVQAGPPKPVSAPTTIVGTTLSSETIVWTWTGVSPTPDGYNVYAATTGVFLGTAPTTSPSFTHGGLAPNTTTAILVAAYTLTGDGPLAASATHYTLSTAPINVAISSVAFSSLRLSWDVNRNEKGTIYEVSQSTDDPAANGQAAFTTSFSTPVPTLLGLTTNQVLISFLQSNTTYHFRVRAFNGAGLATSFSAIVSTRTRAPVSGLEGVALDTTRIQWSWIDPGGVNFFKVYNSTTGAVIATPNANLFTDTGLSTNSAHSVMVSAVTSAGEGPLSGGATTFTLSAVPGLESPPILDSDISTGSFLVRWHNNENPLATIYEIQVTSAAGTEVVLTTTTAFNLGISSLAAAEVYDIKIRSINGDKRYSNYLLLGSTATLARPPGSLTVAGTTPSSISVSWDSNLNTSSATYQVTYSTDSFAANVSTPLAFSAGSNQTSLVITGLQTSTTYSIRVQARNLSGKLTSFSNTITTEPFNGGVAFGSVGGTVLSSQETLISGNLGNGRSLTLRVPPQAFSSDVFVTVSSFTIPPSPCGAAGADIGVSIVTRPTLQPTSPIFLTISYTDAELAAVPVAANQATLMRVDPSGRCVPLETTVDAAKHRLTARLNHLSLFQVAQVAPAASPSSTLIFPNPFYASRGNGFVTFSQMPAAARVRIFTMRGELVFDEKANASGILTWGGTNRSGRSVASGIYLVTVESGADKKILKLAVIR